MSSLKNKLILGTAQLGLDYGINNSRGKPSEKEVFEILEFASENKIDSLDTAEAYGNAIEQIGSYHALHSHRFKVLSKFRYSEKLSFEDCVKISLDKLQISYFEVYSYHSFSDYINRPEVKDRMCLLKSNNLIKKTGISVYTNEEFNKVIQDDNIDVIQIPYNVLDNKNLRGKFISEAKNNGKEIHIRSVFLQGLFFMDESIMPQKLRSLYSYISEIKEYCEKQSVSFRSLALSYPIYNDQIDKVLVGVDNIGQLANNLESVTNLADAFTYINKNINVKETELLNPVNWK